MLILIVGWSKSPKKREIEKKGIFSKGKFSCINVNRFMLIVPNQTGDRSGEDVDMAGVGVNENVPNDENDQPRDEAPARTRTMVPYTLAELNMLLEAVRAKMTELGTAHLTKNHFESIAAARDEQYTGKTIEIGTLLADKNTKTTVSYIYPARNANALHSYCMKQVSVNRDEFKSVARDLGFGRN